METYLNKTPVILKQHGENTKKGNKTYKKLSLSELVKEQAKHSSYKTLSFPKTRRFVLDVMKMGKKKNIIYSFFDVDVQLLRQKLVTLKEQGTPLSLTSYLVFALARVVNEMPYMHAIRKKKKLVIFDTIDVAIMAEKEVMGAKQATNYILRNANKKTLTQISGEVRHVKQTPVGYDGAMNSIEYQFWKMPRWVRSIFWHFAEKNPKLRKSFVGTVGLTSVGMYAKGYNHVLPITPMTLTIAVGTIYKKLIMEKGEIVEHEFLNITIAVDHDIIDGGPMVRFQERFKNFIEYAEGVSEISSSDSKSTENDCELDSFSYSQVNNKFQLTPEPVEYR